MIYARRASPLHAARPVAGIAWCGALAAAALVIDHPLVLGGLLVVIPAAAWAAGIGDRIARAARFGIGLAVLIAVIEPLVLRDGVTLIARLGEVPWLGRLDVTLEATVYGAVLGLRALVVVLVFAVYAAAVDPDEVLRLFRRRGLRSALTVTLATRMTAVLERDARRLDEGRRCRGNGEPSRLAVVRAVAGGALERALDVSNALELRGYAVRAEGARTGAAKRGGRAGATRSSVARAWSRHDLAFTASAAAIVALVVLGEATGASVFAWDPRLHGASTASAGALAAGLLAAALLPFADRRGIAR